MRKARVLHFPNFGEIQILKPVHARNMLYRGIAKAVEVRQAELGQHRQARQICDVRVERAPTTFQVKFLERGSQAVQMAHAFRAEFVGTDQRQRAQSAKLRNTRGIVVRQMTAAGERERAQRREPRQVCQCLGCNTAAGVQIQTL